MTQTVHQTRRERLELLIAEHRSIAALNTAMGMRRDDATFSLIRNQNAHSSTKKPRVMGDELARKVESTLGLPEGWMDTPLSKVDARIEHVIALLESMSEPLRDQAVRVVDALAAAAPSDQPGAEEQPTAVPVPIVPPAVMPAPAARSDAAGPSSNGEAKHDKPANDERHGSSDAHADRHGWAVGERRMR